MTELEESEGGDNYQWPPSDTVRLADFKWESLKVWSKPGFTDITCSASQKILRQIELLLDVGLLQYA